MILLFIREFSGGGRFVIGRKFDGGGKLANGGKFAGGVKLDGGRKYIGGYIEKNVVNKSCF